MDKPVSKSKSEKSRPLEFSCRGIAPVPKPRMAGFKVRRAEVPADPRFNDAVEGEFDRSKFSKAYQFLDEYRDTERKELQSRLADKRVPEAEKAGLEKALTRMQSQDVSRKKLGAEAEVREELKQKELELVAKTGKKPYYAPKSEVRRLVRERAEEGMRKTGQLAKFKAKKERRILSKERLFVPRTRRLVEGRGQTNQ